MGLVIAWLTSSIIILGANCELNAPWKDLASHCTNLVIPVIALLPSHKTLLTLCKSARWQYITAMSIILELLIFGLVIALTISLKMPVKRKAKIVGAFGVRLLYVRPYPKLTLSHTD
jgi:hypothetical protein